VIPLRVMSVRSKGCARVRTLLRERMTRQNPRPLLPTGVPGLDEILGGGIRAGGLCLLSGLTGSGKTILAAQIGFGMARKGDAVLMVTLISESHGKLLDHLSGFSFFDEAVVGRSFMLLNGYESLRDKGADGLLELLTSLASERRPKLMMIEGFATLRGLGLGEVTVAGFVQELNSLVTTLGCIALLIEPAAPATTASTPEQALVDAIIELGTHTRDGRVVRELQVVKVRGSNPILGRNVFKISAEGIRAYPRLEEVVTRRATPAAESTEVAAFGVKHLDAMMQGGLKRGGTTVLLGAPGSGKTLLGLKYLDAGVRAGERALYFGFYESPARLLAKAARVGMALPDSPLLRIEWQPPLEYVLDELAYKLLDAVREHRPRRVLIDGIEGFQQSAIRKERLAMFLTALMVELRSLDVDVLFTEELGLLVASHREQPYLVSALVENIVLLRYAEVRSRLRRLISVRKMRENEYDGSIRELQISAQGLHVAGTVARLEEARSDPAQSAPP
jgi:circadian clock protein KaiC